jgi:flagellin
MKINRNMSAVRANKQLLGTENRLSKSMKRLSSGYKIQLRTIRQEWLSPTR